MHGILVLAMLGVCYWLRWSWPMSRATAGGAWGDRWHSALTTFLLPPLLLVMTAIAIALMGPRGQMVGCWEGWVSYSIALIFLGSIGIGWLHLAWQGQGTLQQIRRCPIQTIKDCKQHSYSCYVLDTPLLYSAQVGFWQPDLVISQGMLDVLTPTQLAAVITHEQAHSHYHDTVCFFWLGWLRRFTCWLPHTEHLWQELLILRELRADSWAAQRVDSLVLAEVLLTVVQSPWQQTQELSAGFGEAVLGDRLTERVNALLAASDGSPDVSRSQHVNPHQWLWLGWLLLPLLTVPFHT
jgi:Zn-dependent protease with chaperone function